MKFNMKKKILLMKKNKRLNKLVLFKIIFSSKKIKLNKTPIKQIKSNILRKRGRQYTRSSMMMNLSNLNYFPPSFWTNAKTSKLTTFHYQRC